MLASHPDYEVVAEVGDGTEAVDAMLRERPNLVFLDIKMPDSTASKCWKHSANPGTRFRRSCS